MKRAAAAAIPVTLLLLLGSAAPISAQELPPEIQVDRLMVQVERQMASEQYGAALRTLDRILALQAEHDLELPEAFWMKRAEAAVGAEDYLEAIESATRYLEAAGREREHYMAALELLDGAVAEGCTPERMTETLESVRACLAAGADPNVAGEDGPSTLDWAAESGDPGITAALMAAGADPALAAAAAREAERAAMVPGRVFKDCAVCPEMVVVPVGSFMMGSPVGEEGRLEELEGPRHRVTIASPFAVGVYEVTFAEWDACVGAGGCGGHRPEDLGWGRGSRPVIRVSWEDGQEYVRWLSRETGETYRLPTEAEWEYVARAGTTTARHWGERARQCRFENGYDRTAQAEGRYTGEPPACSDGYAYTAPVGLFEPNAFGVYDVLGNVREWTQDCWNESYRGAPSDGSAWQSGDCSERVQRGGSWIDSLTPLRSAFRIGYVSDEWGRLTYIGFRVARTMN